MHIAAKRCGQKGAVLLVFMLIILAGSSYMLISRLNENSLQYIRDTSTETALSKAKQALLFYAMNYPELRAPTEKGPGFLPCPDRNNDGNPAPNCTFNPDTSTYTTIGRLPFRILGLADIRDSSGERLWYAVSDNFRNTQSNDAVINSDTPGRLTVDGMGDVVAVIIAPGIPVTGQDSRPSDNDSSEYLEGDNATDDDQSFVSIAGGAFNDRLITITRAELMQVVEQRVINEVRSILSQYYDDYLAYPWLAPFADPKADSRRLTGIAKAGSNSTTLIDTANDFVEWGVTAGDVVRNITDGSIGFVSSVDNSSQLTVTGMSLGIGDDFEEKDIYHIQLTNVPTLFSGTATAGSSGLVLEDTAKDFDNLRVAAGDIFENVTDGSSGMITSVDDDQITVASLSSGSIDSGDSYLIRTNSGIATASSVTMLIDTQKDFVSMGIVVGDLVQNVTDGSYGAITAVATTSLTVDLDFGSENDFDNNDVYVIPKFNAVAGTAEGHLAFHTPGEYFKSGFNLDWSLQETNDVTIAYSTGTQAAYQTELKQDIEISVSTSGTATAGSTGLILEDTSKDFQALGVMSGDTIKNITDGSKGRIAAVTTTTITVNSLQYGEGNDFDNLDVYRIGLEVDNDDGACVWLNEEFIECMGIIEEDGVLALGVVTSGSDTATFDDSTQDFINDGIKRGDVILNYNDETDLPLTRTVDASNSGTATAGSNNLTLEDANNNYLDVNVSVGNTIFNTSDNSSGTIQSVSANQITVSSLSGGTNNAFNLGDDYRIEGDAILYDFGASLTSYEPSGPSGLLVLNNTTGVQGVVKQIIDNDTLIAESYPNTAAISFSGGDSYTLRTPHKMVVHTVVDSNTLTTRRLTAAAPDFDVGEYYRVRSAANAIPDTPTPGIVESVWDPANPPMRWMRDTAYNFSDLGVEVGDIVHNITDGSYGIISDVWTPDPSWIQATLYGGTDNRFDVNDNYRVYHGYVDDREYRFNVRFRGGDTNPLGKVVNSVSGVRKRGACIGYGTDCTSASVAASLPYNLNIPIITITEYEDDNDIAATTTATVPNTGTPTGSIKITNIDYYLREATNELPAWFIKNKWHQYIYVAYSSGDVPGGSGTCTVGGTCIRVDGVTKPDDDKQAIVLSAGMELDASQDRTTGTISSYFENQNSSTGDVNFERGIISTSFNDQVSVVAPVP